VKTLCIVPCGSRKIWDRNPNAGATKARHVYIGPFAKKCRVYAELFYPSSWCILSAKHGFLFPDDTVRGPYNVSFNDIKTNPISVGELSAQARDKGLDQYDRVVLLLGRNYVERVHQVFPSKEIVAPLTGCKGIGYMMAALNGAISRGVPLC